MTTSPQLGLVDTAAQEGLIGREALLRLAEELRGHGLRIKWTGKSSQARGIGGTATTVGVCELPIGLGGVSGVLEVTVIAQDAPLLLPISLLRSLGAVIDLNTDEMQLVKAGGHCKLKTLPSGHSAVSVLDWGESWVFPPACVGKRVESDFRPEASASRHSFQTNPGSKKVRFNASGPTPSSTYACISGSQSRDERMAGGPRRAKPVSSGKAELEGAPRQIVLATIMGLLACCHQSMDRRCRQPCFGTHLRAVQLNGGAAGEGWKGSCRRRSPKR